MAPNTLHPAGSKARCAGVPGCRNGVRGAPSSSVSGSALGQAGHAPAPVPIGGLSAAQDSAGGESTGDGAMYAIRSQTKMHLGAALQVPTRAPVNVVSTRRKARRRGTLPRSSASRRRVKTPSPDGQKEPESLLQLRSHQAPVRDVNGQHEGRTREAARSAAMPRGRRRAPRDLRSKSRPRSVGEVGSGSDSRSGSVGARKTPEPPGDERLVSRFSGRSAPRACAPADVVEVARTIHPSYARGRGARSALASSRSPAGNALEAHREVAQRGPGAIPVVEGSLEMGGDRGGAGKDRAARIDHEEGTSRETVAQRAEGA